ncbi:thaumatin family protein [Aquicella lusitana]|uniref:Thaumatin family protein n=1 Tax=Aquicella lusitana TaxID=254246 RepID=A0A370GYX8_9COXI|nr:thaumatin family protein [Aquicella lusitana]RDI48866.1 thaumatin family protein [Aquicella lusitana]VVC73294.1 hypothetical protein AQULUS_10290 [Aquicella lusitana]
MKNTFLQKLFCLYALSVFFTISAHAGSKAPLVIVSAETVQNMAINTTQTVTYTIKNNVPTAPIQLNMAANKTQLTPVSPLTAWQFSDDCQYNGKAHYVSPNGQCHVSVTISAGGTTGKVQQNVMINYGPTFQTISPAPTLNFNVISSGGGASLAFTNAPTGQNMPTNSYQDLIWTLSNSSSNAISLTPAGINFTIASSLIGTPTFTNDCNNSVPANGECHIQATIESLSTPGHISQYLSVTYNTSSKLIVDTPTNFTISGSSAGKRTFTFVNKCPYKVWFAFNGGGQINGCATNADCDAKPGVQPGTFACNPSANAGAGICFWVNPAPANGNYELAAKTGTNVVLLTERVYKPTPTQPIVWSGNIAGRTGCSSGVCETADCGGGGTGACNVGVSFNQPAMQAEPTFQTDIDFYDITSINGINVPMSIEPLNATRDSFNPYTCGSTGVTANQTASGGTIGGCSWNFSPPSLAYVWVADAGSTPCAANSDCNQANGEACGLKRSAISANSAATMCGKFLGYWTADQVCGINSNYSHAPYTCNAPADGGTTFSSMYQCNAGVYVNSCYTTGGQTGCCGCQNWQEAPSSLLIPSNNSIVQQCAASGNGSSNATWVANALNTLIWYKTACPPNYVYPFDDKSSSFTCSNSASANSVSYRITFCPDGRSGAPSGTIQS